MMLCMGQDCKRRGLSRFRRDIVPVPDVHSAPYACLLRTTESVADQLDLREVSGFRIYSSETNSEIQR